GSSVAVKVGCGLSPSKRLRVCGGRWFSSPAGALTILISGQTQPQIPRAGDQCPEGMVMGARRRCPRHKAPVAQPPWSDARSVAHKWPQPQQDAADVMPCRCMPGALARRLLCLSGGPRWPVAGGWDLMRLGRGVGVCGYIPQGKAAGARAGALGKTAGVAVCTCCCGLLLAAAPAPAVPAPAVPALALAHAKTSPDVTLARSGRRLPCAFGSTLLVPRHQPTHGRPLARPSCQRDDHCARKGGLLFTLARLCFLWRLSQSS
ncbi:hypothetical protein BS50DRAFT_666580, partial [Corynespora cassiicola Philippines]